MRKRIREDNVYKFEELTEDGQEKALENLGDINVDHGWWNGVYDDAENIWLKITSFDIDRHEIDGKFEEYASTVANKILADHGPDCETVRTAKEYIKERDAQIELERILWAKDGEAPDEFDPDDVDLDEVAGEFRHSLLEDYLIMLRKEYEYLTGKEAIIETIKANEYEFTEEGNLS